MRVKASVPVWDWLVRATHWLIAAIVIANLFVIDSALRLHRWLGYAALALMLLRIVWGFVGSVHARFSDWFPTPGRLLPYLKLMARGREPRVRGHNPVGAVMMLALWILLAALGVTGFLLGTDRFFGDEDLQYLHEWLALALRNCVLLHLAGAAFESVRHRENLIVSMITGRKRP